MKAPMRTKCASKRDLFAELSESMTALAQSLTGVDAVEFSRVRNAAFRRIGVERLMAMINGLGSRVEVAVTLRRAVIGAIAV